MEKIQTTDPDCRGICLIAALGIGGYVAANQDTAVQTKVETKQEAKSSNQKIAKTDSKDTTSNKKTGTKQDTGKKEETKSEKTAEKKETTAKKSENSTNIFRIRLHLPKDFLL